MPENIIIKQATEKDVMLVQQIAYKTWPDAYSNILSPEQLNYMLNLFYNDRTLTAEIREGYIYLLAFLNNKPFGFAAFSLISEAVYKLHKLYVLPEAQKTGLGKLLLNAVIEYIKTKRGNRIFLNVNRNNKARFFYNRFGFKIIDEADVDIGNGFYMNDYIMQLLFEYNK